MIRWFGKTITEKVRKDLRRRVLKAALLVEFLVKESMKKGGRTASGFTEKQSFTSKTGKMRTRVVERGTKKRLAATGTFRSKKDEVPRVQTGRLKGDIQHELHDTLPIARVGTFLPYGRFLERGTVKMRPRPFLRPALHRAKPFMIKIFSE